MLCPQCAVSIAGTPKFCPECGYRFAGSSAPPSVATSLGEPVRKGNETTLGEAAHGPRAAWASGHVVDDRYMVVSRLGGGAMGEVYRAIDKLLGKDFALKRLYDAKDRLAELAREVAVAVDVSHPNLLRINGLEARGGDAYLVMEYIDGGSLEELWISRGRRLPADDVATIAASLLDGLAVLHARPMVHLDVKPSNVLRTRAGEIKLSDYGISRSVKEMLAGAGRGAGTPTYMAPEQVRGEVCDGAADIYAVGLMLQQLVSGTLPFEPTVEAAKQWHRDANHIVAPTGTWLDGWISRAISHDPRRRPSATELAAALRAKQASQAVAPVREQPQPEPQWYAHVNGAQVGPMPATELAQRIQARQLDAAALMWSEGMAEWRAIKDVAGWKDLLPKVVAPPPVVVVDPRKAKWPKLPPAIPAAEAGRNPRGAEPVIISIPPGLFLMGAGADDSEAWDDEKPQHDVTISQGFGIWSVPVTQAQYQAVMKANPSHFKGPNRPVEQVSWFDAVRYCNALSRAHGLPEAYEVGDGDEPAVNWKGLGSPGWRLPTAAEWEYACRAGTKLPRYGELEDIAWYDENSGDETHDVGGKRPNGWGLYDTLGNVWEWVWDWNAEYAKSAQVDPVGPGAGSYRVRRGGSWSIDAQYARAACRFNRDPSSRNRYLGFRPTRSLTK